MSLMMGDLCEFRTGCDWATVTSCHVTFQHKDLYSMQSGGSMVIIILDGLQCEIYLHIKKVKIYFLACARTLEIK